MQKVILSLLVLSSLLITSGCSSSPEDLKEEAKNFVLSENSKLLEMDVYDSLVKKNGQNHNKMKKDVSKIYTCIERVREPNLKEIMSINEEKFAKEELLPFIKSVRTIDKELAPIHKYKRKNYPKYMSEMKKVFEKHSEELSLSKNAMSIWFDHTMELKNQEIFYTVVNYSTKIFLINKVKVSHPKITNKCLSKFFDFQKIIKVGEIINMTTNKGVTPSFKVPVEYENGDKSDITVYKENGKWGTN